MPKHKPFSLKPFLIVLLTFIAVFACIFVAIKLLSMNVNETEILNTPNGTLILRAVDGDTLELSSGEIIRLLCVDTPELGKEGYDEAKAFLSSQASLEDIQIERHGFDMYNRTLAWVYSGKNLINKEIIDNGYGSVFPYNGTDCGRVG
jgi:micrococcal nuclease